MAPTLSTTTQVTFLVFLPGGFDSKKHAERKQLFSLLLRLYLTAPDTFAFYPCRTQLFVQTSGEWALSLLQGQRFEKVRLMLAEYWNPASRVPDGCKVPSCGGRLCTLTLRPPLPVSTLWGHQLGPVTSTQEKLEHEGWIQNSKLYLRNKAAEI